MDEKAERAVVKAHVRYVVEEGEYCLPEIGAYVGYGIAALCEEEVVARIADVTTDRALAEAMAERFTRCSLSPIHLKDAVPDLLP